MPLSAIIDMFTDESTPVPYTIILHTMNPPKDFFVLENMAQMKMYLKNGLKSVSGKIDV